MAPQKPGSSCSPASGAKPRLGWPGGGSSNPSEGWGAPRQTRPGASPGRLALTLCCQRRCHPRTRSPAQPSSPGLFWQRGRGGQAGGVFPLLAPSCANSKQVKVGASPVDVQSGGLPEVLQASRELSSKGGRTPGQGPLDRAGLSLPAPATDPGSSCAGNWDPGSMTRWGWGTQGAPEWMEPPTPPGQCRTVPVSR